MSTPENVQQLTITVSVEVAEAVKEKVNAGEFDTESDVFSASFLHYISDQQDATMRMGDRAFDDMLRREVLPVLDALEADPSSGLSLEQVRARLAERRAR